MKKLIVMLMLTLFSIGAYAQTQQGQSSFGFNLGYNLMISAMLLSASIIVIV